MSTGGEPLKQRFDDHSEDAFAALYDRYARSLFRVAWTLLRSQPDAEDAVQEVFLGLARSQKVLGRVQNMRAYLFSALRHAASRLASRNKSVTPLVDEQELPSNTSIAEEADDSELLHRLDEAMAALPMDQREVLSLKIDGEMTFAEIAEVLGIRPNTAASRYRYALEKLRTLLNEKTDDTRTIASGLA